MSEVKKGSCMCSEIQFEYSGAPFSFNLCHCTMCRKFSGGPFGSFLGLKKADFRYTAGEDLITVFKSSDWASRCFCSKCGSSLVYLSHKNPDNYFVAAGIFDDELGIAPKKHIFVKDKCEWFTIADDIPQIERY